jgi:hypothetical protein
MTRLENALKLQAEAMLESAGLPDPLSTSQQNRPSSPTNNSQVRAKFPEYGKEGKGHITFMYE